MARLLLLLGLLALLPTPAGAVPDLRCKGSTNAHVHIQWPTAADRALDSKLHLNRSIPWRVRRWAYLFVPVARAHGLDPLLVAAVMRVESNGDPLAWNLDSNARGLMQVLGASFQPALNIQAGVAMLAGLRRRFASRDLVFAAYNAGPGAVQQYGGIPPYPETRDYVVMAAYWQDRFAGLRLDAARKARYRAAQANLIAFYRRVCGR